MFDQIACGVPKSKVVDEFQLSYSRVNILYWWTLTMTTVHCFVSYVTLAAAPHQPNLKKAGRAGPTVMGNLSYNEYDDADCDHLYNLQFCCYIYFYNLICAVFIILVSLKKCNCMGQSAHAH